MDLRRVFWILSVFYLILALLGLGPVSREPLRTGPWMSHLEPDLLTGKAQGVRSDEFWGLTPRALSLIQKNKFGVEADWDFFLGPSSPSKPAAYFDVQGDFSSFLFYPHNWIFYFFPSAYSYNFGLWILQFLILLAAFELLLLLGFNPRNTSGIVGLAALTTLAWSPVVLRWLVSGIGFSFGYLGLVLWSLRIFFEKPRGHILSFIFLAWSLGCFAHVFYPPAQYAWGLFIPMAFFIRVRFDLKEFLLRGFLVVLALGLGFLSLKWGWVSASLSSLNETDLVDRSFNGGGYPIKILLSWLWPRGRFFLNPSEDAAAWILGWIFFVILGVYLGIRNGFPKPLKTSRVLTVLLVSICFSATWIFFEAPGSRVKFLILDKISPWRLSVFFHLCVSLLFICLFQIVYERKIFKERVVKIGCFLIFLGNLFLGFLWNPIADIKKFEKIPEVFDQLKFKSKGGFVLADSGLISGNVLATFGIRSLIGRLDSPNPEFVEFLLDSQTQKVSEGERKSMKKNPFYFSWDSFVQETKFIGDQVFFQIDPCEKNILDLGVTVVVSSPDLYSRTLSKCPDDWKFETLNENPDLGLLVALKPRPWLLIEPKSTTGLLSSNLVSELSSQGQLIQKFKGIWDLNGKKVNAEYLLILGARGIGISNFQAEEEGVAWQVVGFLESRALGQKTGTLKKIREFDPKFLTQNGIWTPFELK